MEKPSRYSGSKRNTTIKRNKETVIAKKVPRKSLTTVVRTNYSGKVWVEGKVTGKKYTWDGYDAVVKVDVRDIGDWINKPMGSCTGCGGHSGKLTWFEIIGG